MGSCSDDAGAGESDVHVGFREGGEEGERHEEVADAPRVVGGEGVFDDIAAGASARYSASDKARLIGHGRAAVRDVNEAAICNGFEEAQEGDFVRGETGVCRGTAADFGDVDWSAGQSRENQPLCEGVVACEAHKFRFITRHGREYVVSRI